MAKSAKNDTHRPASENVRANSNGRKDCGRVSNQNKNQYSSQEALDLGSKWVSEEIEAFFEGKCLSQ